MQKINLEKMKETYIRFLAQVLPQTADQLFKIIDRKISQKFDRIHLLISSPGGSVFHGMSLYNYLKGLPIEVFTYNFGSVDSIGIVIYCAGKKRFSVPHSRFLMHGVKMNFNGQASWDEKQVEEFLKGIKIDQHNILRIIADTTGRTYEQVQEDVVNRTTLNPEEAISYGLVHEIKSQLLPLEADLTVISEFENAKIEQEKTQKTAVQQPFSPFEYTFKPKN